MDDRGCATRGVSGGKSPRRPDRTGQKRPQEGLGNALYEVIASRYERRPTIITSNKSLTDWGQIVQDVSLAAALLDRLLHHGEVYYLKGPSYRTKGRGESPLPAEPVAG